MATSPALIRAAHHDGSSVYLGAMPPELGGSVRLRVHVPDREDGTPGAVRVRVRSARDGEPRWIELASQPAAGGAWWEGDLPIANPRTSYRFQIESPDGESTWLTAEGTSRRDVSDRANFVLDLRPSPPDWVTDQIAYQIFPDRFARSHAAAERPAPEWALPCEWEEPVARGGAEVGRQFYGGDLDGIGDQLDHLVELGVTTVYLTPVFEGRSNHRYDAVSFDRIDPVLGGDEAYSRFIEAAHARGLKVLGDLTTNHTGVGHEWFGRAQADPESVEAGFYLFSEHPGEYHSWLGHSSLPSLNYTSQELRERIYEGDDAVVGRWLDAGLDGWRIDVANMTGRQGGHQYTREVAQGIRRAIARVKPEAWLLAENFFDAADDLVGESWHGVMDYLGATFPIWRWLGAEHQEHKPMSPLPASEIVATMREVHSRYPWDAVTSSTVHLDSHDLPRFRTIAGAEDHGGVDDGSADGGLARTRHLIGAALQFTLPGVPALFAGDELGLTGANGEHSRTPMPWEHPESWDRATVDGYRELIGLRQEHAALRRGSLRWLSTGEDHLTFVREHPAGRILVHVVRPRPDGSEPPAEPVRLPAAVLGGSAEATTVRGESLTVVDGGWQLPTAVGAHLWRVDGSDLAWESSGL